MDWRGFVILAIGLGVPLALLLHRRERELFAWLCISVGVNIFDARVGINFAAARLVGLLVLPFLPLGAFEIQTLIRTKALRILLASFAYLAILGFVYGFLYPWPDAGYLRPFAVTAPGRVLVYGVRLLADLGIILFVARQILRGALPHDVMRLVLIGTSIAVVGALVEYATKLQIYEILSGFPINEVPGRVRGFNYEPRGLGLTMVQGGFIAFLWARHRRSRFALGLALVHLVVLVLAVSSSALVAAAFGALCLAIFERRARWPLLGFGAFGVATGAFLVSVGRSLPIVASWTTNVTQRFTVGEAVDLASRTPIETLARLLDIFDYTAFMALASSPLILLIGAGPGLIMLPGSNFIPTDARWSWVVETNEGITSPPTMGILLEWSNGGIPMLLLWLAFVVACSRALSAMARIDQEHASSWRLGHGAFIAIATTYLVQASPISAVWPLFMGLGVGAAGVALRSTPGRRTSAPVEAGAIA